MDILKKFSLKDKTAVITGGTGLLGSVYTHSLLSLGASVIVIDKKIDKTKFIKNNSIHSLWNGQEMKNLRQIHKKGNFKDNDWCKRCVNGICGIFDKDDPLLQINKNHK